MTYMGYIGRYDVALPMIWAFYGGVWSSLTIVNIKTLHIGTQLSYPYSYYPPLENHNFSMFAPRPILWLPRDMHRRALHKDKHQGSLPRFLPLQRHWLRRWRSVTNDGTKIAA